MNRSVSCFQEGKVKNHYFSIPAFINSFSSEVSTIWLYQSLPLLLICLLPPSRLIPYIHCTWVTISPSPPHPKSLHYWCRRLVPYNSLPVPCHTELHQPSPLLYFSNPHMDLAVSEKSFTSDNLTLIFHFLTITSCFFSYFTSTMFAHWSHSKNHKTSKSQTEIIIQCFLSSVMSPSSPQSPKSKT